MSNKILIIGSLFITEKHEKILTDAGYELERIPEADPSQDLLKEKIKGKVALINGGISNITDGIFEVADELKAVAFTGADWRGAITGHETARKKGIRVTNAPGGNSGAVAEFSIALALLMQRRLMEIGGGGDLDYLTARTLNDASIGVIGAGNIGSKVIKSALTFDPSIIRFTAASPKPELEKIGAKFTDLDEILRESDVIFTAAPVSAGQLLDREGIMKMKDDALLVHISRKEMIDFDALLERLQQGTLRCAMDWPDPSEEFTALPPEVWYGTNIHTAYNTTAVVNKCSDMAIASLLDMLNGVDNEYLVV